MKRKTKKNTLQHRNASAKSPQREPERVGLRFSPTAWAKLRYFCHRGETEIGGFGITPPEDLLLVIDFATVEQRTSAVTVAFDDAAVADFFDAQVDLDRKPEQFARHWLHTHPGNSPYPSAVDRETFTRVFGGCDWAVMFILARNGCTYARLRFKTGPGGEVLLPVSVDYDVAFEGADRAAWEEEYEANIHPETLGRPALAISEHEDWFEELELRLSSIR